MSQKPRKECLKEKGGSDCAGDGWAWRYLLDLAAWRPCKLWQGLLVMMVEMEDREERSGEEKRRAGYGAQGRSFVE